MLRYSLSDAEARCCTEGTIAGREASKNETERERERRSQNERTAGRAFVSADACLRAIVIYLFQPLFPVTLSR